MKAWVLLALCALLLAPDPGGASWGASGCGPVGPRVSLSRLPAESARPTYEWRSTDDEHFRLFQHGRHVADYVWSTDVFRFVGQSPTTPPWGARTKAPENQAEVANFGIDLDQMRRYGKEEYALNGLPATKKQIEAAIQGAGSVPDDARKLRLTVIGADAERKRVLADMASNPALAAWKDKVILQDYAPDHWAVSRVGFQGGTPAIYFQQSDGKVLHKQMDYADGPEALALALRKADPSYKPDADPDKRKNPILPGLPEVPLWALILGIGGVLVLLLPSIPE